MPEAVWMELVLQPQLNPSVPKDVQALYEVARAGFVYAWLFYPFMTLGAEQCFRVLEAALAARCQQAGLTPPRNPGFQKWVQALIAANIIPAAELPEWESCRKLRNTASHPSMQTILPPGMALPVLTKTAERLNRLFP